MNERSTLVMHVLSDSARARILQPASSKFFLLHITSVVSAGSLLSMRCSSSCGRSGCTCAALAPAEAALQGPGESKALELQLERGRAAAGNMPTAAAAAPPEALPPKMGAAAAVRGLPMTLAAAGGVGNDAVAPAEAVPPNEENGPLPPNAGEAPPPNVREAAGAVKNENALLLLNRGEVQLLPKGKEGAVPLPALHTSAGMGGGGGQLRT